MRTPGRPLISSNCRSSVGSRDGCSEQHGIEHRPNAELLGAVALQRDFRDAAFDHLDANAAVLDVLRRNDRAAQVKAGRAIEVADRLARSPRGRPARPSCRDRDARWRPDPRAASPRRRRRKPREARTGACCRRSPPAAPRRAPARRAWPTCPWPDVQIVEVLFGLPRIEAGIRLLGARRCCSAQVTATITAKRVAQCRKPQACAIVSP